jgi:hypothetical protein
MCLLFHTCLRFQVSLFLEKGPEPRIVVPGGLQILVASPGGSVAPSVRHMQSEGDTLELLLVTHFRNSVVIE